MRRGFGFGRGTSLRAPSQNGLAALPVPLFDLNFKADTYIKPNTAHPFVENVGYTDGYFENASGLLSLKASPAFRRTTRGLYIGPEYTNRVLYNRDLSNAVWVKTDMTTTRSQAGPEGGGNTASLITATAANATVLQTVTASSAQRGMIAYAKRISGSGPIEMTMDGGATWTVLTLTPRHATNGWCRCAIPAQTLANPVVGFRIATTGDAFAVDLVTTYETADIPYDPAVLVATTSAAVKYWRNRYAGYQSTGSGWLEAMRSSYSLFMEYAWRRPTGKLMTDTTGIFLNLPDGAVTFKPNPADGVSVTTANTGILSTTDQMEAINRMVARFDAGAGTASVCLNNGRVATVSGAVPLSASSDHMDLGTNGDGGNRIDGLIARVVLYTAAITDAHMEQLAQNGVV